MLLTENLKKAQNFFREVGFNPLYFVFPVILSFAGAFFEGVIAGLLIPLARGIISLDFSFVKEMPLLGSIFSGTDKALAPQSTFIFPLLLGLILAAAVLKNTFQYLSSIGVARGIRMFARNLREIIFNRYLAFGKMYFDRNGAGYLQNVLLGFTRDISERLINLHRALNWFFLLLMYVAVMFIISWELTLFIMLVFPALHYSLKWVFKKMRKTSTSYADVQGDLSKKVLDVLNCMPLIRINTSEEFERKRFSEKNDHLAMLEFSMDKKYNLLAPAQDIIMMIAVLLLIAAMVFIVKLRNEHIGSFLVYFYCLKKSTAAFGFFNAIRGDLAKAAGPMNAVLSILDGKDKYFVSSGNLEFKGLEKCIQFDDLNFHYMEGVPVLRRLTLNIERGKITALVGPTGSGKTTISSLLLRLYDCPASTIKIDGTDIREYTLESLYSHMSLVSQEPYLFNDTLKNNVVYGIKEQVPDKDIQDAFEKARLGDFINGLPKGHNTIIGDRGVRLSGGERQRLSIARALLKKSEILFLDEATSALDTKTEKQIQGAINDAVKDKTVVVIAHRLSTIKNADKIIVLEKGRLVEEGPMGELLDKKGKFYEYWEEQKFY
ncbi:ABC transporter ATP-binding protein [Candidatus Omnitrophota bacterium]